MARSTTVSLPQESYHDLIVQFLAEMMQSTIEAESPDAFQKALQTYCDCLRPWLDPSDCPPNPRAVFSLLDDCAFDETSDNVTVVLSPETTAFFRTWLRRNQVSSDADSNAVNAWSN